MKIPRSIGIIPDGNRRWAKKNNFPNIEGHRKGLLKFKRVGEWCLEKGISTMTIFSFSSENKNRSEEEIKYLTKIVNNALNKKNIEEFKKKGVRLRVVGDVGSFSCDIKERAQKAEEETRGGDKMGINVALNYGGRWEILSAAEKMAKEGNEFTEENFSQNLAIKEFPDLIIRTGKEKRLSNFMLWQAAYSELYFSDSYWPEFSKKEFEYILEYYAKKERRFGR